MRARNPRGRRLADRAVKVVSAAGALVGIVFLVWILYEVVLHGAAALNWGFFTELPAPPGGSGGASPTPWWELS